MGAYVTINPTPSGDITGSGTAGYLAMFTSANVIGDSLISQSGSKVYVGASNAFVVNTSTIGMSIGYDLQSVTIAGVTYNIGLSIHNESGTYVNQELHAASALTTVGAILLGNRSRGTNAAPTVVQSSDNLFDIYACGYDGTDYAISSAIEMEVSGTVAANQVPGRIKFSTANSSGTLTEAMSIYSTQQVSLGNYASPTNLRLVTIGQDTAYISIGSNQATTSEWAMYGNTATPSGTNYFLKGTSGDTSINAGSSSGTLSLRTGSTIRLQINGALTSGASTTFNFTVPANTGQTASTEISDFKVNGATKTWAAGAITTQRWNYFTANTAAFASASTITNSYGLYVEAATAGTNATITNNWAAGFAGDVNIISSSAALYLGDLAPSSTNYALKYTAANEISLNAPTTLRFRCGGTLFATGSSTDLTINGTAGLSIANNANDTKITLSRTTGNTHSIQLTTTDYYLYNNTAAAIRYGVTNAGNFYVGAKAALATTATDGFLYVPSCAGIPTGIPTAITGKIAVVCDSTNNKMYIYSGGAWVALN